MRFPPKALRRRWVRRRAGLPRTGRIFGIGLSRTATMSLSTALGALGYRSLHFPADDASRERIMGFFERGDGLELPILERFDAATDTPVCASFEGLDRGYPGSRFILTTREREQWLQSCWRLWVGWVEPFIESHPDNPGAAYLRATCERLYGGWTFDRVRFARAYDDHHERVRRHFRDRPDDLLVIDICGGEGWSPLCAFLRLRAPRSPFPWADRMQASAA